MGRALVHALLLLLLITPTVAMAQTGTITINLGPDIKPQSATATAAESKAPIDGVVAGRTVTFSKLDFDVAHDVKIALHDGTILQGIDMGWHSDEPPAEPAELLDDDDREQIRAILVDVPRFYNKCEILRLSGSHDRATALVRLVRDKEFYADKGGEIIWRIELWYFKNQFGGWEAVQQANKVLRRERLKNQAAYDADAGKIRFHAELGGIRLSEEMTSATIDLKPTPPDGPPKNQEKPPAK